MGWGNIDLTVKLNLDSMEFENFTAGERTLGQNLHLTNAKCFKSCHLNSGQTQNLRMILHNIKFAKQLTLKKCLSQFNDILLLYSCCGAK